MCITCAWIHPFGKLSLTLTSNYWQDLLMSSLWACGVVSAAARCPTNWFRGMQFRFFPDSTWKQHQPFVSAYLLRLQCQSAGSLKTQECIISPGYSCGPCGFYSVVISSSHLFFLHFLLQDIFAYDNTCGDCSFKLDLFLGVFTKWCQILPVSHWIEQAIHAAEQTTVTTSSIFKFLTWVPQNTYLYCVSHCIWIYNLFYLSANY